MSWSDNNNNDPWGSSGNGSGRRGPGPNMDDVIRNAQNRFKGMMPGSFFGKLGPMVIIGILILIWLASGFYRVLPDEQGVVLQFGKYTKTTQPGLNYHLPYPIERVFTPKVTKINRIDVGYRQSPDSRVTAIRDVEEESLMLTGDENIVDIDFSVFWLINDAGKFLFNVQAPELTVKSAAETAMRESIGQGGLQSILTEGRTEIEEQTRSIVQEILDEYILQSAEGYRQKVIADSEGKAARFLSIQTEYAKAPQVTKKRIFYETMEDVFSDMDKVIIDKAGGDSVVPYLPLPELSKKSQE